MKHDSRHLQRVARIVRKGHGMELTPSQVGETLDEAIAHVRAKMIEAGHEDFLLKSDEEVLDEIRASKREFDEADPDTWTDEGADRIYAEYAGTADPMTQEQADKMWESFRKFAGSDKDPPLPPARLTPRGR